MGSESQTSGAEDLSEGNERANDGDRESKNKNGFKKKGRGKFESVSFLWLRVLKQSGLEKEVLHVVLLMRFTLSRVLKRGLFFILFLYLSSEST